MHKIASPIALVKRKNGGIRFCVDYRWLNALERKDVCPMSHIDNKLDQLGGKRIFSILNAHTGYWQIKVEEGSCEKTTLITIDGLYEYVSYILGCAIPPSPFKGCYK